MSAAAARAAEPDRSIVEVRDVRKVYRRDSQQVTVLDGIELEKGLLRDGAARGARAGAGR
jgi:hypothetical protein